MKFSKNLFAGISRQFSLMLMLACVLVLTVCATSYGNTATPTSNQQTTLPSASLMQWNQVSLPDGIRPALFSQSNERLNRFTSFTDCAMQLPSAVNLQSNLNSAAQIPGQLSSSANSTTFTFQNSAGIRANRFGLSSENLIWTTARLFSDVNLQTNWKISGVPLETNLKILPTGQQRLSFKLPSSEFVIGRTSEVYSKPELNSLELSLRSTTARRKFALDLTANSLESQWHTKPFSVSVSLNRANLPMSFMSPTLEKQFQKSQLRR